MHPRGLRCSFFKYGPIFSVVAPCPRGFWGLILIGLVSGELGVRRTAIFVALWIAGRIAAAYVLYGQLFAPYVAVLDIALVFLIFKGDVRLS